MANKIVTSNDKLLENKKKELEELKKRLQFFKNINMPDSDIDNLVKEIELKKKELIY